MKRRYWRRLFILSLRRNRLVEATKRVDKMMFGLVIPMPGDFSVLVTPDASDCFMVGRMAERESISASLPLKSTLFHSGLLSELNVLIR
jgi:hypothetical protein